MLFLIIIPRKWDKLRNLYTLQYSNGQFGYWEGLTWVNSPPLQPVTMEANLTVLSQVQISTLFSELSNCKEVFKTNLTIVILVIFGYQEAIFDDIISYLFLFGPLLDKSGFEWFTFVAYDNKCFCSYQLFVMSW